MPSRRAFHMDQPINGGRCPPYIGLGLEVDRRGQGIHWVDLDENIRVEGLLAGPPPGESQNSLKMSLRGIEWVKFIGESSRMGSRQGIQQFLHLKQVDQVDVVLLRRP